MGNNESKVITKRMDTHMTYAPTGDKSNLALSRGEAQAHVIRRGKTAIAMAQGPDGAAWISTNCKRTEYGTLGNGRIIACGGIAYAAVGSSNQALAYSHKAAKKAMKRGYGSDLYQIDGAGQLRYIGYR